MARLSLFQIDLFAVSCAAEWTVITNEAVIEYILFLISLLVFWITVFFFLVFSAFSVYILILMFALQME